MADFTKYGCLAITQTLKPTKHKLVIEKQLLHLKVGIRNIFKQMPRVDSFYFVFEFTERGVFHAHGYALIEKAEATTAGYVYNELAKSLGFCTVKQVFDNENLVKWKQYIEKDILRTIEIYNAIAEAKKWPLRQDTKHFMISYKDKNDLRIFVEKPVKEETPEGIDPSTPHLKRTESVDLYDIIEEYRQFADK